jgi:predicted ATPase
MAIKGQGSPEVERVYSRARALCEQVGEPSQLFRILWGLRIVYIQRGDYRAIQELEEQLLSLAQRLQAPDLLLETHHALWSSLFLGGEPASAQPHLEQGRRLYDPQRHRIVSTSSASVSREGRIFSANPSRKRMTLSSRALDVLSQLYLAQTSRYRWLTMVAH